MADQKISQLTAATTPLAGTEVLPIVQGSATKKVSIDNLTAGKAVAVGSLTSSGAVSLPNFTPLRFNDSGGTPRNALYLDASDNMQMEVNINNKDLVITTYGTGGVKIINNIIQGTAAKGVNFTANTPAAGMTSQLLNAYEEGTWSPVYKTDGTNFPSITMDTNCAYTRVGRQVTVTGRIRTDAINTTGATGNVYVELPFTPSKAAGSGISNSYEFASNYPSSVYCDASSNRLYLMRKLALNSQDVNVYAADMFNGTNANKNQIDISFTFFV